MTRDDAWCLLTEFTLSESLRKHALSVEACLRAYARKFGEDEELWGMVGLIHDFDYEKYPSADDHPFKGSEILKERGVSEEIRRAILSHANYSGVPRESMLEKTLFACDELAGFITASALVKPNKSLAEVEAKSSQEKNEGQSLRPLRQPRRHHQRRRRDGRRPRRAHRLLHRGDESDRAGVGLGRSGRGNRLEFVWESLGGMKDTQDFDDVASHPIGDDVGRKDQLAGANYATGTA